MVKNAIYPFMDLDFDYDEEEDEFPLTFSQRILGLVYAAICGTEGMKRICDENQEDYIRIPPATRLRASGIEKRGLPFGNAPLCKMSFNNDCLFLPRMKLYDSTILFIRNMAKYEELNVLGNCMFHDYILLKKDLINFFRYGHSNIEGRDL